MARSHGSGIACYRGQRPASGTCDACRKGNAIRNHKAVVRYSHSAKGILSKMRHQSNQRGNA
jgi:hypothetical protein